MLDFFLNDRRFGYSCSYPSCSRHPSWHSTYPSFSDNRLTCRGASITPSSCSRCWSKKVGSVCTSYRKSTKPPATTQMFASLLFISGVAFEFSAASARIMSGFWLMTSFILALSFTGQSRANLVVRAPTERLNTLEDFLKYDRLISMHLANTRLMDMITVSPNLSQIGTSGARESRCENLQFFVLPGISLSLLESLFHLQGNSRYRTARERAVRKICCVLRG